MDFRDFSTLVPWVIAHGYLIFFLVVIIEGPLTTMAAGIAASLGYFDIYLVALLSFAGEISADFIYFNIGYAGYRFIRLPFFRYLGLTEKKLEKIQNLVHKNIIKATFIVRMSPLIGAWGVIIIGSTRPKFKKFFTSALSLALPKTLFFTLLGYFSGRAYLHLNKIIAEDYWIIIGMIFVLILFYLIYLKIISHVVKKMGN